MEQTHEMEMEMKQTHEMEMEMKQTQTLKRNLDSSSSLGPELKSARVGGGFEDELKSARVGGGFEDAKRSLRELINLDPDGIIENGPEICVLAAVCSTYGLDGVHIAVVQKLHEYKSKVSSLQSEITRGQGEISRLERRMKSTEASDAEELKLLQQDLTATRKQVSESKNLLFCAEKGMKRLLLDWVQMISVMVGL